MRRKGKIGDRGGICGFHKIYFFTSEDLAYVAKRFGGEKPRKMG